jgi:hypothetical protein
VALDKDRFRNPRGVTRFMSQDEFELHFLSPDEFELRSMEGRTTRYIRARPYAPSAADLAALSGRYETDEIGAVEITPASNALSAQLNGSPLVQLTPVHPDVFQRGAMTIRFQRDVAGKVIGLDLSNPVLRNVRFLRRSVGTSPPAPAPAQARSSDTGLARYEGTYALEGPNRTLDLRVWVDAEGRLNGEMVGSGQQMIFRPSTEHKFLHPTQDDLWVLFTVDDGRATSVTMHSPNREISGPRKQ